MRFPGSQGASTRDGLWIEFREFPAGEVHQGTGEPLPVVVACATPPVPPSLLEAAAHPLTGAEHIAAGSMEYETDIFESDDELDDDHDSLE